LLFKLGRSQEKKKSVWYLALPSLLGIETILWLKHASFEKHCFRLNAWPKREDHLIFSDTLYLTHGCVLTLC